MAKKKKTKKERFIEAAEDLNQVLGLDPAIETSKITIAELSEKLLEAKALLYEDDKLKKNTEKVLEFLSAQLETDQEQEEDEDVEESEDKQVEEPADEETEDEESDQSEAGEKEEQEDEDAEESEREPAEEAESVDLEVLREKVADAGKRKELLTMAMGDDVFSSLSEELPSLKTKASLQERMLEVIDVKLGDAKPKKKKKAKKSGTKDKPEKKRNKRDPKKTTSAPGDRSNKEIVYQAWDEGEDDVDKLHDLIEGRVKKNTVRSWRNAWNRGKNLPAAAK